MAGNVRIKTISVLLTAALLLSLAGCQQQDEEAVKLVEKPKTDTVIRMFSGGGAFSTSNQAKYWSENFIEMTGINAVVSYNEESQYYADGGNDARSLLRLRIESSQPDDMYIVSAEDMIEFSRKGYILDMTDFDFVDNLSEPALQLSTIDGKVYCLPLSYTGYGLYWNVDLLKEYNLEVPGNYEELIAVWDILVENGITPYAGNKGYGLTVPAMCASLAKIYQSPDKDRLLAELADGTVPVSTYVRDGFEFIKLMCDRGYMDPMAAAEAVPGSDAEALKFLNGEAACVCARMSTRLYCDPEASGFEVKMTGWPLLENGKISVTGTDQKLCVNPASKHLDIVSAFIEMAGSEEALMKCTEDGKISAGKINDPSKYRESEEEFARLIQSGGQIPNTDMNLKLNLWENIRDISRLILTGEASVDDACRMLDETQMQDIKESGKNEKASAGDKNQ